LIGFDRPLHPRWIYETLLLAQPGQRLSELNKPFENIARELTGKKEKEKRGLFFSVAFCGIRTTAPGLEKSLF
jgi:hypothetical protein